MKKNKFIMASVAALMAVSSLIGQASQVHTAYAAESINKTIMHTSIAYDKDGNDTGVKYNAYKKVNVDSTPVTIGNALYYKVSGKNQYIKTTNIDGVIRKITHNAYIYSSSKTRTTFNGQKKLLKGQNIITYGTAYKFKDGKYYIRIGGPKKQYVKTSNIGAVIKGNTPNALKAKQVTNASTTPSSQETTVTVTKPNTRYWTIKQFGKEVHGIGSKKTIKVGTRIVVDRLEHNQLTEDNSAGGYPNYYHVKGTDKWLNEQDVKADKKLPIQNYFLEHYSYVKFIQPTDLYTANGEVINFNGDQVRRQSGQFKVDKAVYIWVPSENKADLFYHLVAKHAEGSKHYLEFSDAYVKANNVQTMGVKLTPKNTLAQAQADFNK